LERTQISKVKTSRFAPLIRDAGGVRAAQNQNLKVKTFSVIASHWRRSRKGVAISQAALATIRFVKKAFLKMIIFEGF
jgi:hypothetical protein